MSSNRRLSLNQCRDNRNDNNKSLRNPSPKQLLLSSVNRPPNRRAFRFLGRPRLVHGVREMERRGLEPLTPSLQS